MGSTLGPGILSRKGSRQYIDSLPGVLPYSKTIIAETIGLESRSIQLKTGANNDGCPAFSIAVRKTCVPCLRNVSIDVPSAREKPGAVIKGALLTVTNNSNDSIKSYISIKTFRIYNLRLFF